MRLREYSGPLTVLTMGILGFSLFCIVSAVALSDRRASNAPPLEARDIVNSAFSNMNTMAALTVEVITQYVLTATPSFVENHSPSPTIHVTGTPTLLIPLTSNQVTRTRIPPPPRTFTPTKVPTLTASITPSHTPIPTLTYTSTPVPTFTRTATATVAPTDTDTPPPPTDTDTPVPPTDTDTPVPPTEPPTSTPTPEFP